MSNQDGGAAYGIAFVFQTFSTSAIGEGEFGMGYYGIRSPGLAVEFDVSLDTQDTPIITSSAVQHVSVHNINNADESSSLGIAILKNYNINITDGLVHQVVIQQQNGSFMVFLDKMVNPIINIQLNVSAFISSTRAIIGFTGSTGPLKKQDQSVHRWIFDYIPNPPPSVSVCQNQVSILHEVSLPSSPPLVPIPQPHLQPQPQPQLQTQPQPQPQLQSQPQLDIPLPQPQLDIPLPQPQLDIPQPQPQQQSQPEPLDIPQPQSQINMSQPQPQQSECDGNTPEGTNFQCINNVWQSENLTLLQETKLYGTYTVQGSVIVLKVLVIGGSMNIQNNLVVHNEAQMQIDTQSNIVVQGDLMLNSQSSLSVTTTSQLTIKGCVYFNNSTFNLNVTDPISTTFQMNYTCQNGTFGAVFISQSQCAFSGVTYKISAFEMGFDCSQHNNGQISLKDILIPLVCSVLGLSLVGGSVALVFKSKKYEKELKRVRGLSKKIEVNVVTTTIPTSEL